MRLSQFSQGFDLSDAIAEHVTNRVGFALGTASDQINTVSVRMTDVNADRGGNDKRCRMVVDLRGPRTIVVEATHADLYTAIDDAAAVAKEAVWRHLKRRQTLQREHANRSRHLYA
jgi:ribosome-associated translation inhibitor RaiA